LDYYSWTLPGNTALAVSASADYAIVDTGEGYLILAEELLSRIDFGVHKVFTV